MSVKHSPYHRSLRALIIPSLFTWAACDGDGEPQRKAPDAFVEPEGDASALPTEQDGGASGGEAPDGEAPDGEAPDGEAPDGGPGADSGFSLVVDLNERSLGASPFGFLEFRDSVFFSAEGPLGDELYRSDGVSIELVRDLYPGPMSSSPEPLLVHEDKLYISATNPDSGRELWVSDGSRDGTVLLARGAPPNGLAIAGGKLLFFAGQGGPRQLYASDGTPQGTAPLFQVDGKSLVSWNGRAYFYGAALQSSDYELWTSDGTAEGTRRVLDIRPGLEGSSPSQLTFHDGALYFYAHDGSSYGLWKSDGSAQGTSLLTRLGQSPPSGPIGRLGPYLYAATNGGLWRSNGTAAGTTLVPGSFNFWEGSRLLALQDKLYFEASDAEGGSELWRSDLTLAGTGRFVDLMPGVQGSQPADLVGLGGAMYFVAHGPQGRELYRSDGTQAGTSLLRDLWPGPEGMVNHLAAARGALWFNCSDASHESALCVSDGSEQGTRVLGTPQVSSAHGVTNSFPAHRFQGKLLFAGDSGNGQSSPYLTDGTAQGTVRLADVFGFAASLAVSNSERLYFLAYDQAHGGELWTSDGTPAGTRLVKDIHPGAGTGVTDQSHKTPMALVGDVLYFAAFDGLSSQELWRTDGTEAGTRMVQDLNPDDGRDGLETQAALVAFGGGVAFVGRKVDSGYAVYRFADEVLTRISDYQPARPELAVVQGKLLFNNAKGELCVSDGTLAGAQVIVSEERRPNALTASFHAAGERVVFVGNDDSFGAQLWTSDGTSQGTYPLTNFNADEYLYKSPEAPLGLFHDGHFYFAARDVQHGVELWVSDFSSAGARLVGDINVGVRSSDPRGLMVYDGQVYFSAEDAEHGAELRRLDKLGQAPELVGDLYPGAADGRGAPLGVLDGYLLLIGDDGRTGQELWRHAY